MLTLALYFVEQPWGSVRKKKRWRLQLIKSYILVYTRELGVAFISLIRGVPMSTCWQRAKKLDI